MKVSCGVSVWFGLVWFAKRKNMKKKKKDAYQWTDDVSASS